MPFLFWTQMDLTAFGFAASRKKCLSWLGFPYWEIFTPLRISAYIEKFIHPSLD